MWRRATYTLNLTDQDHMWSFLATCTVKALDWGIKLKKSPGVASRGKVGWFRAR
jgi:hypothetical protein